MLVPALRYFVCNGCGTVYADLEPPAACPNCAPRYERQRDTLAAADETFDRPVREVPLLPDDEGLDRIRRVSDHVPPTEG